MLLEEVAEAVDNSGIGGDVFKSGAYGRPGD